MKHGVQRAATTEFAHLVDDRPDGATAASPPRHGHAVSEAIVSRFVTAFDAIAIFGTGIATMQWHSSTVDWRLEGLVVLLGSLLGLNFLRLAGRRPLQPVRRSGHLHRPCAARLAADAGCVVPGRASGRAVHRRGRAMDRPVVLGRRRAAGGQPRRPASPDEDLESRRTPGRGRRHRRRRTDRAAPAAQHECDPGRPTHFRRLRRRGAPPCRDAAWATPFSVRSTSWSGMRAFMASTPSSSPCRRRPITCWSRR